MAEKTLQEALDKIEQGDYSEDPLPIQTDTRGQPYIQWKQADNYYKRAWIQHRPKDTDWAGTGRYLNVVKSDDRGPSGNATDFPIYNDLPDEQVLRAFVYAVNAITGCK